MISELKAQLEAIRTQKALHKSALQTLVSDAGKQVPEVSIDISDAQRTLDTLLSDLRKVVGPAASLSGPVATLEKLKKRAETALQRVQDLSKLSDLMQILKIRTAANDLEAAAQCVQSISQLTKVVPMQDSDLVQFTKMKESINAQVKVRFGEALAAGNEAETEKFAGLINILGLSREGIDSYISYILQDLNKNANQAFDLLQASDGAGKHEEALVRLFRMVAKSLNSHKENLLTKFGADGVLAFIKGLRRETDLQSTRLFSKFRSDRKIERLEEELKRTKTIRLDLKETDSLCGEIATLIQHSESFENYFHIQTDSLLPGMGTGMPKISELKMKLQELVNTYVSLETLYMTKAITKAVEGIDVTGQTVGQYRAAEVLRTGPATERIDELFYVLKQSTQRALRTFNIDNICAILNHIPVLLTEELLETLRSKAGTLLKQSNSVQLSLQSQQPTACFIVVVNLLDLSQVCAAKLVADLKSEFVTAYGNTENSEHQMFLMCLDSLMKAGERFKAAGLELLTEAVDSFTSQVVALTAPLSSVSYELTEEQLAEFEVNDPFAHSFSANLKGFLRQWKAQLEPDSSDSFIDALALRIAEDAEKRLKSKKCNDLGAVQLEKDLREMTKAFQSLSQRPVRLRFLRLKQMTQLLSASSEAEVQSLIRTNDWKLTMNENRQVLTQKIGNEFTITL